MRTTDYKLIYDNVLNLCGIEQDLSGVNQVAPGRVHWRLIRDLVNNRLKLGYQAARWPETCVMERRVTSSDETEGSFISLDQPAQTSISEVFMVRDSNPKTQADSIELQWYLSENGIQIVPARTDAWVFFRRHHPRLTGGTYNRTAGTRYSVGEQVYDIRLGNFYELAAPSAGATPGLTVANGTDTSPSGNTSLWTKVDIPDVLRNYLIRGAFADYLRHNGQMDQSHPAERDAQAALDHEVNLLETGQGQYVKYELIGTY